MSADGREAPAEGDGVWWAYTEPDYRLADGGFSPADLADATGHIWSLDYVAPDARSGLQLTAWDREPKMPAAWREEFVGTATVDGYDATLWRHPGVPEKQMPPSVGAKWKDGDMFLWFGGGGFSEDELREHLPHLQKVTRSEWEAPVNATQEQQRRLQEEQRERGTSSLPPG